MLGGICHGFGYDEIRAGLDAGGQALVWYRVDVHGKRGVLRKGMQRRVQAGLDKDRRMDARRQLAQLLQCAAELFRRFGKRLRRVGSGAIEQLAGTAQPHRQRDQPLLRAVVEIALQAPSFDVSGLDDARA